MGLPVDRAGRQPLVGAHARLQAGQCIQQFMLMARGTMVPRATATFLILEGFELDPACALLHEVCLRLIPPDDLPTIEQAVVLLGIQRTMTYQWIEAGMLHSPRVGPYTYQRCEHWEIELVMRERCQLKSAQPAARVVQE
jgi:hypothetical protein